MLPKLGSAPAPEPILWLELKSRADFNGLERLKAAKPICHCHLGNFFFFSLFSCLLCCFLALRSPFQDYTTPYEYFFDFGVISDSEPAKQ